MLSMHHRHNVPVNALYKQGHGRVGCYPCIYANKEDIRLIALHAPEVVDKVRELENRVTSQRAQRNLATPDRYKNERATFFNASKATVGHGIDDVVSWSKTAHGGRQFTMLPPAPTQGCARWGLCEPPDSERT